MPHKNPEVRKKYFAEYHRRTRDKIVARQRKRREERRSLGLCIFCPSKSRRPTCLECRIKKYNYDIGRKAKIKEGTWIPKKKRLT